MSEVQTQEVGGRPTADPLYLRVSTEQRQEFFYDSFYCIIVYCSTNRQVAAHVEQI